MENNEKPTTSSEKVTPSTNSSKIDISKLFLPGSILLAGVLVAGTILYTNLSQANLQGGENSPTNVLTGENFKKWAKELKLNTAAFASCYDGNTTKSEIAKDAQDGTAVGVEGTPTFFINGTKMIGAQPFEVLKAAIDQALAGKNVPESAQPTVDDDPVLGQANAPVTIIEFSDFECPFCRRFWQQTLPEIQKQYIDTGKAKLVYRDFPLSSIHPGAEPAAQAANCANIQGKFWEMHDLIFEKQI